MRTGAAMLMLADARELHAELRVRAAREYIQPVALILSASAAGKWEEAVRYATEGVQYARPVSDHPHAVIL